MSLTVPKTKTSDVTPWKSILIVVVMTFCTAMQGGLYYSSIWPYLKKLDNKVEERFLGAVMAMYSFGQLFSAPAIGWLSNKVGSIRWPIIGCVLLQMTGNIIYFLAQAVQPPYGKYVVMLARFILGVGSVNLVLLDIYTTTSSLPRHKSRAISMSTGGMALGICIGPGLQLFFTPLGRHGIEVIADYVYINMYTAGAVCAVCFNLTALFMMGCIFDEVYAGANSQASKVQLTEKPAKKLKIDFTALIVCHVVGFIQYFTFSHVETLGTTFSMTVLGFNEAKAIEFTSVCFTALSVVELGLYTVYIIGRLEKISSSRFKCAVGLVAFLSFYLATFSWPFLPGTPETYSNFEVAQFKSGNGTEPVGCNTDVYPWCESIHVIDYRIYLLAMSCLLGLGYAAINTTLGDMFSDVLGPKKQGTQMGFLHMTRNSARMMGPLIITWLYQSILGPQYVWLLQIALLTGTIILFISFYHRMVPMSFPTHQTFPLDNEDKKPATQEL